MASENKGFFDVMKKVVAEIEKPKISFDFGFHGESVTVGLVAAIKSFQDLNKQKEASRRANYPSGGIIQGKGHEEFVLPIWRTPSEIHEQALKDNLKTERFSILPKGTIYHDIAASNNFNDKKKVYFYFIDRKRRTIKTIVDANEYRGIRDSLLQKIYWKWA